MATSADVAARAGVSRSTVSQILNGHGHRFKPDMVAHVRKVAQDLGYRPSVAARTLALGTSDIVITLIPNITFGSRLRELIDQITVELAQAGKTNLLRLASSDDELEDAVLGLRPAGVWSIVPLSAKLRTRLEAHNVRVVEAPRELQIAIDMEIGALQAAHLRDCGYETIGVAMPVDRREQLFATSRERGVLDWCRAHGVRTTPTLHLRLERGGNAEIAALLPGHRIGIAAYNDDVALAILGAASLAGRLVPEDIGVIGVDNSRTARLSEPTITTVDIEIEHSAHQVVQLLLHGAEELPTDALDALDAIRGLVKVIPGGSTGSATR
jgi:DNA-binding LacI/PurR family transcriptional regulator